MASPNNVIGENEPIDENESEEEKKVEEKTIEKIPKKIDFKRNPEIEIFESSEFLMEEKSIDFKDSN